MNDIFSTTRNQINRYSVHKTVMSNLLSNWYYIKFMIKRRLDEQLAIICLFCTIFVTITIFIIMNQAHPKPFNVIPKQALQRVVTIHAPIGQPGSYGWFNDIDEALVKLNKDMAEWSKEACRSVHWNQMKDNKCKFYVNFMDYGQPVDNKIADVFDFSTNLWLQ